MAFCEAMPSTGTMHTIGPFIEAKNHIANNFIALSIYVLPAIKYEKN